MENVFKLLLICGAAALALSLVNSLTEDQILKNREEQKLSALQKLAPGSEILSETSLEDDPVVQEVLEMQSGEETLYILQLKAQGYGGEMTVMAAYEPNGVLRKTVLLTNQETVGIGKKAEAEWYMAVFENKSLVPRKKGDLAPDEVDVISGSTVTFSAIAKSLESGAGYIKENINE
jgi:RnfABCDGE-type electron transport complex G subunit